MSSHEFAKGVPSACHRQGDKLKIMPG